MSKVDEMNFKEKFDYLTQRFMQGLMSGSAPSDGFRTANAAHDELIKLLKPHQVASIEKQCMHRRQWEAYCYARKPNTHIGWWRK